MSRRGPFKRPSVYHPPHFVYASSEGSGEVFAIAQTRQSFAGVEKKGWFILEKTQISTIDLFQDYTRVFPCLF